MFELDSSVLSILYVRSPPPIHGPTLVDQTMDKIKLTGQNLGRVCNYKLGHAFVYAMPLHT